MSVHLIPRERIAKVSFVVNNLEIAIYFTVKKSSCEVAVTL